VPLDDIAPGDRLLIRQGDVVPVDGTVVRPPPSSTQSALTGESLPAPAPRGRRHERFDQRRRGLRPDGDAPGGGKHLCRDRPAGRGSAASKAPMSRLADRWSLGFLAVTVAIAFAAWWFTGDPIRAVAVLVVATPCPLILAVPVALVAGCRARLISAS
jgi:cation transport ATPase